MNDIYQLIPREDVARFFKTEREKTMRFLMRHYRIDEDTASEAFQNGCHALLENVHQGKLSRETLTCSLSTYLTECCRRQLLKSMKTSTKETTTDDLNWDNAGDLSTTEEVNVDDDIRVPADKAQQENDFQVMEEIVADLPSPCNELIWGKYYHQRPSQEMAERLGYRSSRVAITTLNRCMEKLKQRFKQERRIIYE